MSTDQPELDDAYEEIEEPSFNLKRGLIALVGVLILTVGLSWFCLSFTEVDERATQTAVYATVATGD